MNTIMIQPILPILPTNPLPFSADTALSILVYTAFLAIAGITAFLMSLYASEHFKGDKKKTALIFIGISLAVSALLLCFFGCAVSAVKGIIFCLILVFSSYSDIKTRESDDYLAVMIALTAFIGIEISDIPGMILSAVLITFPMLLVVIICNGKAIGGADIKLSAACAFLLGITKGFTGLIAGLTIGIIVNIIIQTRKNKAESFPLIPYLAAGFMAAYFI
jgi:leader peptidase (prepilin peptidase)/N-methyltransferase